MRIILLGDIHMHHLFVWPWKLIGKRVLGQLNLWLNRRKTFKVHLLKDLFDRVTELKADMLLFSGDFTTTALSAEFQMVREIAGAAMERCSTFAVPGNHDRYTMTSNRRKRFERYFAEFTAASWPYHRQLAPKLHMIGLDPTRPTLFNARGKLGEKQIETLDRVLKENLKAGDRLIVLCHYPLGTPPGYEPEPRSHALIDADRLIRTLNEAGYETLYLHGHVHAPWCRRLANAPNIVDINAGAPIMIDAKHPRGQGFWEIEIPENSKPDPTQDLFQSAISSAHHGPNGWILSRHVAGQEEKWRRIRVEWPQSPGQVSKVL